MRLSGYCTVAQRSPESASKFYLSTWILAGSLWCLVGCGFPKGDATQTATPQATTAVDVAVARLSNLTQPREYTGTTQPLREVSLRSQIEGQVLRLNVDVGDRITQGQALARVDDALLLAAVTNAEAELAARQSEVSRLRTQESEAETRVEQVRLQLQQANADANRFDQLAKDGATSQQRAEQSRTEARTTAQVLRSAEAQVRNQQAAIAAAQKRVAAQQALVNQAQQRRAFAVLNAPITGTVVSRTTEVGNLVQPGTEVMKLGDFSQAKVTVQVSELELGKLRLGNRAQVKLDALPKEKFVGTITRISPAADQSSRLVPVEITIPNPAQKIGSGLLARVSFDQAIQPQVVVPLSALQTERSAQPQSTGSPTPTTTDANRPTEGTLFVVSGTREQGTVNARIVDLGKQADGRVEIVSGLKPGEKFVARSGKPLKEGEAVRFSILSEQ